MAMGDIGHHCPIVENGDLDALAQLLDSDVVLRADGGGVVRAAMRPIEGRRRVLLAWDAALRRTIGLIIERWEVNGEPGFVANPDKLRRLPPAV
ncbi:MAG: hypothetical protein ACRD0U_09930 [Acidimicrobiales bacterium]